MRKILLIAAVCHLCVAQTASELNFTSAIGELRDMPQRLPRYFVQQTQNRLSARPVPSDQSALKARGAQVRQQILKNIGSLPERTPLNARVVGVVDRPSYRIEKIIFESQPKFFVAASLYLPKTGTA